MTVLSIISRLALPANGSLSSNNETYSLAAAACCWSCSSVRANCGRTARMAAIADGARILTVGIALLSIVYDMASLTRDWNTAASSLLEQRTATRRVRACRRNLARTITPYRPSEPIRSLNEPTAVVCRYRSVCAPPQQQCNRATSTHTSERFAIPLVALHRVQMLQVDFTKAHRKPRRRWRADQSTNLHADYE
jgi:hypothetical protein